MKLSRGGIWTILIGLPLLIVFMPIIIPSVIARFRILEPIIEQMNVTLRGLIVYNVSEDDIIIKNPYRAPL